MYSKKVEKLIAIAQKRMRMSRDPSHDLRHTTQVVKHVEQLMDGYNLKEKEREALVLAAWWHDVGRTTTKGSLVILFIMTFVDDLISALFLWRETIKIFFFGSVPGMATRIIYCKNGTWGSLIQYIWLRKRTRMLRSILEDADNLELLSIERLDIIRHMAEETWLSRLAYKKMVQHGLKGSYFVMNNKQAYTILRTKADEFLQWVRKPEITSWHIGYYGKKWAEETARRIETLRNSLPVQ